MKYIYLGVLLLLQLNLGAQSKFNDTEYFLIDSLETIRLSQNDSLVLVTSMEAYHNSKHDTIRLKVLEDLIDNCWNEEVWPRYNAFLLDLAQKLAAQYSPNSREYQKCIYYKGIAYGNRGYFYDEDGDYINAKKEYLTALDIFTEIDNIQGQGKIYNALAGISENLGDIREAIDYYSLALKLAEASKDLSGIANASLNIGSLHLQLGTRKEALNFLQISLDAARENDDFRIIGSVLVSEGKILVLADSLEEAEENCVEALKNFDKAGAKLDALQVHLLMGEIKVIQKDYGGAETEFQHILEIANIYGSLEYIIVANNSLAELKLIEEDYDLAEKYALESYKIAKTLNFYSGIEAASGKLTKIYEEKKYYQKANYFLNEYANTRDSLRMKSFERKIFQESAKYEFEKIAKIKEVEHQNEILRTEVEKKRLGYIVLSALLILLVVVVALMIIYSRMKVIRQQKMELDAAYSELEERKNDEILVSNLKALQSQMNPHFIFNALNSIQTLVLKGDVDNSYSYINKFADLVRQTLMFSERPLISFEEEVGLLENYLTLEKLRFRDNFNYSIKTNQVGNIMVPSMLLQPLLENALKHGLLHKKSDKLLTIDFELDEVLKCTIVDNGIGRKAAEQINKRRNQKHQSFALEALRKRFEFLKRKMNVENIGFHYEDLYEDNHAIGTKVVVIIPFVKQ